MPVRLEGVPPLAVRPVAPRLWRWSGLLLLMLLLTGAGVVMFAQQPLQGYSAKTWWVAMAVASASWGLLLLGRMLHFFIQQCVADGWDQARNADWSQKMEAGRHFLHVLDVSLYTELRAPGQAPEEQLAALIAGAGAIRTQPSRQGIAARHSRLPEGFGSATEDVLQAALNQVLNDLGEYLALLPDDSSLAVLFEADSALPQTELDRVWQQAWRDAAFRQPATRLQGQGLEALDQWLDQQPMSLR